jgi:Domain of unknown function (DUF4157)
MGSTGEVLVPQQVRAALEHILGAPIGQVKVIEHSWFARMHPRVRATTRRDRIYLTGSAQGFFADPVLMLHEYCHVIRQWGTGQLTVPAYLAECLRCGYQKNRFEVEARAFAAAHAAELKALLARA